MTRKPDYHHGNLRAELIEAGIAILDEVGWAGLSLRGCAARAGVSHAAPAHHFGNLTGLRTALATVAYSRFVEQMDRYVADRANDGRSRLMAAGLAYIAFARENPGLFHLMFGPAELDQDDIDLNIARRRAYEQLGENVAAFLPPGAREAEDHRLRVAVWSLVHGYAQLILAKQIAPQAQAFLSDEAVLEGLSNLAKGLETDR